MIEIISIFSFDTSARTLAEREAYYLGEYVTKLRALPGLRKYVVGRTMPVPGAEVDHARVAVLYFDDMAAFAGAMATPSTRIPCAASGRRGCNHPIVSRQSAALEAAGKNRPAYTNCCLSAR